MGSVTQCYAAAAAYITHDHMGRLLKAATIKLNHSSASFAELVGAWAGIKVAIHCLI